MDKLLLPVIVSYKIVDIIFCFTGLFLVKGSY